MALTLRLEKGSELTYQELDDNFTYLSSSIATGGGGGGELTQPLTTNITVGGLASGTSYTIGEPIEDIIRAILVTYIPATVGDFSLLNGASPVLSSNIVREVGNSLGAFDNISFTAAADNPDGRFPTSASFTASGASTGDFNAYLNNSLGSTNTFSLGGSRTVNRSTDGTVTFTLNTKNPQTSATIAKTRTVSYIYPFFYGMSATDYSSTGNLSADAGLITLLQGSGNKSLSISGTSKFVYFAYPASYGVLSSIKDGNGFEIITAFTRYTRSQSGAGSLWTLVSYNIYKSGPLPTTVNPAQTYTFTF